jgi:hypothetical protein
VHGLERISFLIDQDKKQLISRSQYVKIGDTCGEKADAVKLARIANDVLLNLPGR